MAKQIKIAYIGGGSRNWARHVMTDLALCEHLTGEIALYDIDYEAAQRNVELAQRIYSHPDAVTAFDVHAHHSAAEALQGADFVFLSILPGPMEMFANDLDIPAKYGILQTVGDTTGPGGISRALRAVPAYLDYAHQIMEHCPDAWAINYTNPMTLCTAAFYAAEPKIKAFGCCHEVFGTQHRLAGLVESYLGVPRPERHEIATDVAGVNHFTFATAANWQGTDLFPIVEQHISQEGFWDDRTEWALEQARLGHWFHSQGVIAYDYYRHFGALGAAGDRHLAEFVPWYLVSEGNLHRYGVILTPSSYRLGTWQPPEDAPTWQRPEGLHRSGEEGVAQMMALLGIAPLDTNVNLPNRGQIPGLPLGAVVETNAQFRHDSLSPVIPKALPAPLLSLIRRVVEVQQITLQAAVEKDRGLAFQALLNDPLCTIPVDQAWQMFDELLTANHEMLPGWDL
ncbi:MAG: alpha-galactosidase [Anaerolineae bacterium]|jgi:alpha-galactosidase/6-phospho-beta-glucosidase family protein